ncbi:GntR family transcriptional regulator [Leucobacter sp. GX24907]
MNQSPDSTTAAHPALPSNEAPERVLFRRIQTINVPSMVARRLRSAIGLGLIADDEKLPKEATLAAQLGISTSALREGLGKLRDEGLIVTRPGKNGGSFVQSPAESTFIAEEALTSLSAAELRDLGDWREMLAARSASLAAVRSSERTADRLRSFADALLKATTLRTAIRALSNFHTELALGAQSMRLSTAQFTMYEEYDWLTSVLLTETSHRQHLAGMMRGIASAVRQTNVEQARTLSSDMVSFLTTQLTRKRLRLLSEVHQTRRPDSGDPIAELATALNTLCHHVLDLLSEMSTELSSTLTPESSEKEIHSLLSRLILSQPGRTDPTVFGLCFLAEPGFLTQHHYLMSNWERNEKWAFELDEHHVLDTQSEEFYDYPNLESFALPRQHHVAIAAGPYIDQGGVDDYLITFGLPVLSHGDFIGGTSADIRVVDLERLLAPVLVSTEAPLLVVSNQSRIILSNTPAHAVGNMLHDLDDFRVTDLGFFGWRIASR